MEKPKTVRDSLKKNLYEMWDVDQSYPLEAPFPDNIMIEVTNACNLRCGMCYQRSMNRPKGFMRRELFERVISQAAELGIGNAGLFTTGEAFLHPEIFEFIRIAKERGIGYVYITTNGVLLDERKIGLVFDSGLDSIKFSIDAATRETYESERPGGDWDRLLDNIRLLRDGREQRGRGPRLFGSYVITAGNVAEAGRFRQMFTGLLDEVYFSYVGSQGGNQTEENKAKITAWLAEQTRSSRLPEERWNPCNLLWNRFVVTYDGKLTICCVDFEARLVYGDLLESTLAECWNSEKMRHYRSVHRERRFDELPMCRECDAVRIDYRKLDEALEKVIKNGN